MNAGGFRTGDAADASVSFLGVAVRLPDSQRRGLGLNGARRDERRYEFSKSSSALS